jgi:Zn-dependent metalloprotease
LVLSCQSNSSTNSGVAAHQASRNVVTYYFEEIERGSLDRLEAHDPL